MNQYQIVSNPRHIRHLFFVDESYSYDKLFALMNDLQKIWGGRYNPIIPIQGNAIPDNYISLLEYYDPDFIYYSDQINPEIIKSLNLFNPCEYVNMDRKAVSLFSSGVRTLHFYQQFPKKPVIRLINSGYNLQNDQLLGYFKINFGIDYPFAGDDRFVDSNPIIDITPQQAASLNEIILEANTINQAHLSRLNSPTRILRSLGDSDSKDFEIVLAKDQQSIADLFYFWNRLLYEGRNILIILHEELHQLRKDPNWKEIIIRMCGSTNIIHLCSNSFTKIELEDIIKLNLKDLLSPIRLIHKDISSFPFQILDDYGYYSGGSGELSQNQTILSEYGRLKFPNLTFSSFINDHNQKWMVDLEIRAIGLGIQNRMAFPLTTDTQLLIQSHHGRINQARDISVVFTPDIDPGKTREIQIQIRSFKEILPQLVCNPNIHGQKTKTKYKGIGLHDSSKRLASFLELFRSEFDKIEDYLGDKFWIKIFETLSTSEKKTKDAISFDELKASCIADLEEHGFRLRDPMHPFQSEENLILGLKRTLAELCQHNVFFTGFNLKCPKCSSMFWYSVKEASEMVVCKGCQNDFRLPIESSFAYKLNDLVKNNIFQTRKERDGNLTVIRTLAYLHRESFRYFDFSPQINLFGDELSNDPISEIDIICVQNGNLIIGEAKHSSDLFIDKKKKKSLDSLFEIANSIFPDEIILSCYDDSSGKLAKAKKYLEHKFSQVSFSPKILAISLDPPDSFNFSSYRYFYR